MCGNGSGGEKERQGETAEEGRRDFFIVSVRDEGEGVTAGRRARERGQEKEEGQEDVLTAS